MTTKTKEIFGSEQLQATFDTNRNSPEYALMLKNYKNLISAILGEQAIAEFVDTMAEKSIEKQLTQQELQAYEKHIIAENTSLLKTFDMKGYNGTRTANFKKAANDATFEQAA